MPTAHILYHGRCPDGAFSAAIAQHNLKSQGFEVQTYPQQYKRERIPTDLKAQDQIYVLDFALQASLLESLESQVSRLVLIDHHSSNERDLGQCKCKELYFVQNQCACTKTWEFFHGQKDYPMPLQAVEDRDLWRWSHPLSKPYLASLDLRIGNYEDIERVEQFLYGKDWVAPQTMLTEGSLLLQYQEQEIQLLKRQAFRINLFGHQVLAADCSSKLVMDELGAQLAAQSGTFSVLFKQINQTEIRVSFRSVAGFDLIPIADFFGGGGHEQACACVLSVKEFSKIVNGNYKEHPKQST